MLSLDLGKSGDQLEANSLGQSSESEGAVHSDLTSSLLQEGAWCLLNQYRIHQGGSGVYLQVAARSQFAQVQ